MQTHKLAAIPSHETATMSTYFAWEDNADSIFLALVPYIQMNYQWKSCDCVLHCSRYIQSLPSKYLSLVCPNTTFLQWFATSQWYVILSPKTITNLFWFTTIMWLTWWSIDGTSYSLMGAPIFGARVEVALSLQLLFVNIDQCCQTYGFLRKSADFEDFPHKSADFLQIIDNFERNFLDILYTRLGKYFC